MSDLEHSRNCGIHGWEGNEKGDCNCCLVERKRIKELEAAMGRLERRLLMIAEFRARHGEADITESRLASEILNATKGNDK